MPFSERIRYRAFLDNREYIESKWSKRWGDRKNELVFIGQDVDREKMTADLEECLLQDHEQEHYERSAIFSDPFPKDI